MGNPSQLADDFESALLSVNRLAAKGIFSSFVETFGLSAATSQLIRPALERIGVGWVHGHLALAQVYMSGRICEELVRSALPSPTDAPCSRPIIAIAVLEDHHQLGSLIVRSVLRASGFEVLDYGHGIKAEELAQRAAADGIRVLLISTLMLPAAMRVKELRRRLNELGADVTVVVGGAPFLFDEQLWREVGADTMGRNATEAIEIVARLVDNKT